MKHFLPSKGTSVYLILATGYKSKKTLGLKISKSRKLEDLKVVFEEAQKNVKKPIKLLTVDGWGAYQTLAKELRRNFTLVIHPHKKPYDQAWIMELTYQDLNRIITQIGVNTDIFKRRATREFHFLEQIESISLPVAKLKGRPKGTKNEQVVKNRKRKNNVEERVSSAFLQRERKGM